MSGTGKFIISVTTQSGGRRYFADRSNMTVDTPDRAKAFIFTVPAAQRLTWYLAKRGFAGMKVEEVSAPAVPIGGGA